MGKALVALDTEHIKKYVLATDKLKDIRGASSLLDTLNRTVMEDLAREVDPKSEMVYANGGAGLFLLDSGKADDFGKKVQEAYRRQTGGGAAVTYAKQDIPAHIKDVWHDDIWDTLELLRYSLQEVKDCPPPIVALPSHPFMRLCDACGVEYASPEIEKKDKKVIRDAEEANELYCVSCLQKRYEDNRVRDSIEDLVEGRSTTVESPLWTTLLKILRNLNYRLPHGTKRPSDFNVFSNFKGAKDYFGIIYADANGMGKKRQELRTLQKVQEFAEEVDYCIYRAVCDGIEKYLAVDQHSKQHGVWPNNSQEHLFPFDILLIGGDDVLMVTPASVAMDIALMIAKNFHEHTNKKHTLSVGVVLAPVKYPFGLLRGLAEGTLKFAKKEGAKQKISVKNENSKSESDFGDTRINFMTVTGSTSLAFTEVHRFLHDKPKQAGREDIEFYATLRPYDVKQLTELLEKIREGHKKGLGRTKLHQLREAILKKNLTTSVQEALMVLRNWKEKQRAFMVDQVYKKGAQYQQQYSDPQNLATMFPRVTFPWFADGKDIYRTNLLDFVELYDFVAGEEVDSAD